MYIYYALSIFLRLRFLTKSNNPEKVVRDLPRTKCAPKLKRCAPCTTPTFIVSLRALRTLGAMGNHERNEVERIVFNGCCNIGVMTLEMDGHGYSYLVYI